MFLTLLNREFLHHLKSARFSVITVLCLVVVVLFTWIHALGYIANPPDVSDKLKQVTPLTIMLTGVELSQPDNPVRAKFPLPRFSDVIRLLFSLLAILMTYDAICGDKERGVLRLVFSSPVKRGIALLAKWASAYIVTLLPLVLAFMLALIIANLRGALPLSGENLARLAAVFIYVAIYMGFFTGIGLAISATAHRPGTAMPVALVTWFCFVFIIPSTGYLLARWISPVPSMKLITYQQNYRDDFLEDRMRVKLMDSSLSEDDKRAIRDDYYRSDLQQRSQLKASYLRSRFGLIQAAKVICRLSPSFSLSYVAATMSGLGPDENVYQAREPGSDILTDESYRERFEETRVSYAQYPDLDQALMKTLPDYIAGLAWMCLALALAITLFIRYDVR
ncbi:ABC transporter permease [candidate division KSB1 bacterium]